MTAIADQTKVAQPKKPFVDRIGPLTVIYFGLSLAAVWTGLLAYGLVKLIEMAIQ
jgi:hypothetical protein